MLSAVSLKDRQWHSRASRVNEQRSDAAPMGKEFVFHADLTSGPSASTAILFYPDSRRLEVGYDGERLRTVLSALPETRRLIKWVGGDEVARVFEFVDGRLRGSRL